MEFIFALSAEEQFHNLKSQTYLDENSRHTLLPQTFRIRPPIAVLIDERRAVLQAYRHPTTHEPVVGIGINMLQKIKAPIAGSG
jgi:hypothetical protein